MRRLYINNTKIKGEKQWDSKICMKIYVKSATLN